MKSRGAPVRRQPDGEHKGHADTVENNRCDELAVAESQKFK